MVQLGERRLSAPFRHTSAPGGALFVGHPTMPFAHAFRHERGMVHRIKEVVAMREVEDTAAPSTVDAIDGEANEGGIEFTNDESGASLPGTRHRPILSSMRLAMAFPMRL